MPYKHHEILKSTNDDDEFVIKPVSFFKCFMLADGGTRAGERDHRRAVGPRAARAAARPRPAADRHRADTRQDQGQGSPP